MTDVDAARQRAETVLERMEQDKGPADCAFWAEAAWDLAQAVIKLNDAARGAVEAHASGDTDALMDRMTWLRCVAFHPGERVGSLPGEGSEASP